MTADPPPIHRFSHDAMNTTFEVLVRGEEERYARQAARAAFEELDRIERELSRFIESSDVAQINRLRAGESVCVGIATFECLRLARQIHADTHGTFDVTIGALKDCWQPGAPATKKIGSVPIYEPAEAEIEAARTRTGMHLLKTDETEHSVSVAVEGVTVDLGAIGKGYAVDQMAALLREWSIEEALVHSGESSVFALGAWTVAIRDPQSREKVLDHVQLRDRALSGSGLLLHGPHILDPRTGRPAGRWQGAWALAPNAALCDALSTGFMVMSTGEVEEYCARHADVAAMLVTPAPSGYTTVRFGQWT